MSTVLYCILWRLKGSIIHGVCSQKVSKDKTYPDSKLNYHWQKKYFKEVSFKCQTIRRDRILRKIKSLLTGLIESSQEVRIDQSLDVFVDIR